jgi:CheY-like chemotaxis protein
MTQAVTQVVVVVEFDEELRTVLHDILTLDGHYPITAFSDETAALAYLAAAPERVIVVVSNRDVHHTTMAV